MVKTLASFKQAEPVKKPSKKEKEKASKNTPGKAWSSTNDTGREVVYPVEEAFFRDCRHKEGPITYDQMKIILEWETEEEHIARNLKAYPKTNQRAFEYGDDFLLKDVFGNKVRCWNVARNRPFTEAHCKRLMQEHLKRRWAGPTTMEGQTVNGESFIIGRTAQVVSGQHRGIGFMLACQEWEKNNDKWKELWPSKPVFETLLVRGISEDPRVVQTLDNVRPRSASDVFYTSDLFSSKSNIEKFECSRMLDRAVGLLWRRTGADSRQAEHIYQTHSESIGFVERHVRLLECIQHIFEENGGGVRQSDDKDGAHQDGSQDKKKGRAISMLQLSAGQCAAVCYLMGVSNSDIDAYRNATPPGEQALDFSNWDTAIKFWSLFANRDDDTLHEVREAIKGLADVDTAAGGREVEKLAVLAKAWEVFQQSPAAKISRRDMDMSDYYYQDADGIRRLKDPPDFGGIDLGPKITTPATDKEVKEAEDTKKRKEAEERRKMEERRKLADKATEKIRAMRAPTPTKPANPKYIGEPMEESA